IGHLITASGLAGLLKMLGAMEAGVRPPALHTDAPIPELVNSRQFRLPTAAEPWDVRGPRRAAINAFGFGGNNAHLLVEQWQPGRPQHSAAVRPRGPIAIVGLGVCAGDGNDAGAFAATLLDGAECR